MEKTAMPGRYPRHSPSNDPERLVGCRTHGNTEFERSKQMSARRLLPLAASSQVTEHQRDGMSDTCRVKPAEPSQYLRHSAPYQREPSGSKDNQQERVFSGLGEKLWPQSVSTLPSRKRRYATSQIVYADRQQNINLLPLSCRKPPVLVR